MQGIKKRWIYNYMLMILIILLVFEIAFILFIKNYFYNNILNIVTIRAEDTVESYNRYLINENYSLSDIVKKTISDENINNKDDLEFQILDTQGNIKVSSSGFVLKNKLETKDVLSAKKGQTESWVGKDSLTRERIMAVSAPLEDKYGNVVGIVRYVTSLEKANNSIGLITVLSMGFFFLMVIIIVITGLLFSKTIIEPINEINKVAKKMAEGKFSERIMANYNDEIGELGSTLNYLAEEIVESTNLKNEFISSVSHELRTPLTSIKGWSETILEGDFGDKDEAKLGLKIISKETTRLANMVEELLDFSKIESGRIVLHLEALDMKKEIEDIVNTNVARAKKEEINLSMRNMDEKIPYVFGDRDRLKQIFINIIDNAIKFTPKNKHIYIDIKSDENYLNIIIEDEGIGIDQKDILQITEKFYKGKSKKSGSGIGLAITKELIDLHKGKLEIESTVGIGTKVTVRIPVEIDIEVSNIH